MKLRARDRLALSLVLILAALWGSSYFRSLWVAIDWSSGLSQGPTLSNMAILHSEGRLEVISSGLFIVETPPVGVLWTNDNLQETMARVVADAEVKDIEPLPGVRFRRAHRAHDVPLLTSVTVSYLYPALLVALCWASPSLWRRCRKGRRRCATQTSHLPTSDTGRRPGG